MDKNGPESIGTFIKIQVSNIDTRKTPFKTEVMQMCDSGKMTKTSGMWTIAIALLIAGATLALPGFAYGPFRTPATAYIENGDRVVLNQRVSVSAGSRIYLQNGIARLRSEIKQSKPYCYFHLYRAQALLDSAATLNADTFSIESKTNLFEYVLLNPEQVQYAGFITQDTSQQTLITKLKLRSANQPEVIGLNCGIWAVPNERNHLSLEEITSTLGDLVTLELGAD